MISVLKSIIANILSFFLGKKQADLENEQNRAKAYKNYAKDYADTALLTGNDAARELRKRADNKDST